MKQCMYCGWQFAKREKACPACQQLAPKPRRLKRKIGAGLLVILVARGLFGGNSGTVNDAIEEPAPSVIVTNVVEELKPAIDGLEEGLNALAPAEDTTQSEIVSSSVEWREFLQSYEEFIDEYLIIMDKMDKNPNDVTVLLNLVNYQLELADLMDQADHVDDDLTGADLADYVATMSRINVKLASAL